MDNSLAKFQFDILIYPTTRSIKMVVSYTGTSQYLPGVLY